MPQGMPAVKSLSEPASRVRRSLEGLNPSLAIKRFDTVSLALPKTDTGILFTSLRATALAKPELRSTDAFPIESADAPALASLTVMPVPPLRKAPGMPSPFLRRAASRDDISANFPTDHPDPVTLSEILGGLDHGTLSVTGRLTSGSGNAFLESSRKNKTTPGSRITPRLRASSDTSESHSRQTRFASVEGQISLWLNPAATGWKYSGSKSFWSKAPERSQVWEALRDKSTDESTGAPEKLSAPAERNESQGNKNPIVELARLVGTNGPIGFPNSSPYPSPIQAPSLGTKNPFADTASRPSVSRMNAEKDGQSADCGGSERVTSGAYAGLPAVWQRALAAFSDTAEKIAPTAASPGFSTTSETSTPSSPGGKTFPGTDSQQSSIPNPVTSASPLETTRRLREGLPEHPSARTANAEVNWFAEEELADQLSRILGSQARRRGIDLS